MSHEFKSTREDGRGHWRKGVRRNPPTEKLDQVIAGIKAVIAGGRSQRWVAKQLRVSKKTLAMWLSGKNNPAPDRLRSAGEWLDSLSQPTNGT